MKTVKLVCPSCSAEMEVDEEKLLLYCPYCGKKLQMDFPHIDEVFKEKEKTKRSKERTERVRMEHEYRERTRQQEYEQARENEKAGWKVLIILFLLSGLLFVGAEVGNMVHRANGEVKAPISGTEESLKDLDYEDARLLFISEGLEYVQLVNKHDLIVGLLKREGKVESISINGETNFSKGSWFPPDAIVKITYHGF